MRRPFIVILHLLWLFAIAGCGGTLVEVCEETIDPHFLGCYRSRTRNTSLLIAGNACNKLMGGGEGDILHGDPFYLFGYVTAVGQAEVALYRRDIELEYHSSTEGCTLVLDDDANAFSMQCPDWEALRFERVEEGAGECLR